MEIEKVILGILNEEGEVRTRDVVQKTGFSRAYVSRFFKKLCEEGALVHVGKANGSKYVPAERDAINKSIDAIQSTHCILTNRNLEEDIVFNGINRRTGILKGIPDNILNIVEYAFTEMLNNAIEHSQSEKIEIKMRRRENNILFEVRDTGIGIFNNVMAKKKLKTKMEAIQDLLKGKLSTEPASHSGEGIFFTSKVGDVMIVQSSNKKIVFDNLLEDIYIRDVKETKGTRVSFSVGVTSNQDLSGIFRAYTDEFFEFSKTNVIVKLYAPNASYISRSQARRILSGLEKFKTITLDFNGVDTVGQAFADEIFRIWKRYHSDVEIKYKNVNENIEFMIKRVSSE